MADCTRRCRSRIHGSQLTSSITRRGVSDEALASYLRITCANFTQAVDKEGRTVLHMAASRGRKRLVEWLAKNSPELYVNMGDVESGFTALHRSLFYGQVHVAVALMKLDVSSDSMDKDDYRALDHVLLDRHYITKKMTPQSILDDLNLQNGSSERCLRRNDKTSVHAYVWGSDSNYTLGTENQQQRRVPDELACFTRSDVSIKQVCLGKFHSVWVTYTGAVWACGQGGRFGAPHAGTIIRPKMLQLFEGEQCRMAAVTLDSTVFLLENGWVLQYKMNESDSVTTNSKNQSVIKLRPSKPLIKLQEPLGLCASRNHAMVWNKRAIYTWGFNYGQLGHSPEEKFVDAPKRVAVSMNSKEETSIELGAVSEAASVFNTSRGDVYLLHDHICKKIAVKQINLKQLSVECRDGEGGGGGGRVTVLLLDSLGKVLYWHNAASQLTRCIFGLAHQIVVTNMALTHDLLFFTTREGEAYQGVISRNSTVAIPQTAKKERDNSKSPLVKLLEKDDCTSVKIRRIPNLHRAVSITVDTKGLNFACLQWSPHSQVGYSPRVSRSCLPEQMDSLRSEANEEDLLHDVVFKVGNRMYPAHMFIIASYSDLLYGMYQEVRSSSGLQRPTVQLEMHPDVFERILQFMYTGCCDVARVGLCGLRIKKEELEKGQALKEDVDIIESPAEISAFEVYKGISERKKSNRNKKQGDIVKERPAHVFCDPVKLVQAAAKRLQVMALHKTLEKFYYREGCIHMKDSATLTNAVAFPSWSRASFPELVDTTIVTKDGVRIPAHKCILAARLEYFSSMFMHSWTESQKQSTVTLPINHTILEPIIDFLYTDDCDFLSNNDNIDFLCNLLIVADQLFVTRLREMCELNLSYLVTLRNCSELCQFAHTYNSDQLKNYCMEFICVNLCTLLENKALHMLDDDLLEDITKYYREINTIMAWREITTFYDAPDEEVIIECAKMHPVDMEQVDEELKRIDIKKKKKTPKKNDYSENEKERMRHESVSSVSSLDLSQEKTGDIMLALKKIPAEAEKPEERQEKWVKVQGQQKQQKVVQARLKAINSAKEILNEKPVESFTMLANAWQSSPPMSISRQGSPGPAFARLSVSPKESTLSECPWKSPQSPIIISHIGAKLSQKQRKKLALQGCEPTSPQNIEGYLSKVSLTESPPTPKNPWKVVEPIVSNVGPLSHKPIEFNQILADQQKQKENSSRIMTKSLVLTQLEDKAIDDLIRFYNADEADEEWITVRRIELQVSSPQWINTASK